MTAWTIPEIWNETTTVYLLGGGPSLSHVDVDTLRDEHVIAINNTYRLAPWADFLYFMDCAWYFRHEENFDEVSSIIVTTCNKAKKDKRVRYLDHGKRIGVEKDRTKLSRGSNSGYGAVSLAVQLGAKRIILLGYDMKVVEGKHNYHDEHWRQVPETIYADQFIRPFEITAKDWEKRGVEIINATPRSALKCFPIVEPESILPKAVAA